MLRPLALLAESDASFRQLLCGVVAEAGFEVFESSSVPQLDVALRVRPILSREKVLLVLAVRLASLCTPSVLAASRERARLNLPLFHIVWTCEFGTLSGLSLPQVGPCFTAVLEKPFDLQQLQAAAAVCLRENGRNGTGVLR